MAVPKSVKQVVSLGYIADGDKITSGLPETDRAVSGEMLFEIKGEPITQVFRVRGKEFKMLVESPAKAQCVVPYTPTYRFGKPRALRASDRF